MLPGRARTRSSEPEPVYEFGENIATVATLLHKTCTIQSSFDEGLTNAWYALVKTIICPAYDFGSEVGIIR